MPVPESALSQKVPESANGQVVPVPESALERPKKVKKYLQCIFFWYRMELSKNLNLGNNYTSNNILNNINIKYNIIILLKKY